MTCFCPRTGYRSREGRSPSGGWPIVFDTKKGHSHLPVEVPCGKCIGCRLDKTAHWAMRIMCEAHMHEANSYITLTYREEDLNESGTVSKEEVQNFFKRLRYELSQVYPGESRTIRYFSAGEYGDKYKRPHYHAAIFGEDFGFDKLPWKQGIKDILYRSPVLEKAWGKGICTVQELNIESALYIAKYVVKKLSGERADIYGKRQPEFALMSRKPGLANGWLMKYMDDVKSVDGVVIRHKKIARPGRYFDGIIKDHDPEYMERIKDQRKKMIDPAQCTERRLEARAKLKIHQQKWRRLNYEK